jgi:hypothetical protein
MVPDVQARPESEAVGRAQPARIVRSRRINIVGIVFRTAFILAFGLGALWSSLPVSGRFSNILFWPAADLFRAALGAIVCLGSVLQVFRLPKDEQAYTTWTYIGTACAVTLLCVFLVKNLL